MILWTRISLASFFAAAALAATGLAWHGSSRTCPVSAHAEPQALPAPAVPAVPAVAEEPDAPTPEAIAAGDDGAFDPPGVPPYAFSVAGGRTATTGELELAWLPASYVRDLTPDQTRELADVVNGWIYDDEAPAIDYRRGVVRVHSDEDRGDEPPYPLPAPA